MNKYNITISSKGETRVETAEGHKELHTNLALFRAQGWEIVDISRADKKEKVAA